MVKIQKIVDMLIKESKPKMFRGKPTNRRMFNFGNEYYDSKIPSQKKVPIELKKYFNIPQEYNNCFVNVYKNNDLIGLHKDKKGNMNINKKIISISIGLNKDNIIETDKNLKLGWMEIDKKKIDIYNNKKIFLDYETPHRAKTKIKDNIQYRINFTFRVSKNFEEESESEESEDESENKKMIFIGWRPQTNIYECKGCDMICEECENLALYMDKNRKVLNPYGNIW